MPVAGGPDTGARRGAPRRPRSAATRVSGRRLARTIVLATLAVAFAIYWLSAEMGLDRDELLGYVAASLLLVGVVVVLGMLLGTLLWLIRRTAERRRGPPPGGSL